MVKKVLQNGLFFEVYRIISRLPFKISK